MMKTEKLQKRKEENLKSKYYLKIDKDEMQICVPSTEIPCLVMSKDYYQILKNVWVKMPETNKECYENDILEFIIDFEIRQIEENLGRKLKRHWE